MYNKCDARYYLLWIIAWVGGTPPVAAPYGAGSAQGAREESGLSADNREYGVPMKDLKLKKRYLFIAAALLAGILFLAGTLFVQQEMKRLCSTSYIAALLSGKLGCPVSIEKSQVMPMNRLSLQKISIAMPGELNSDDEVASIPEATVMFNPWLSLWHREAAVQAIELREPRITLTGSFIDWLSKRPGTKGEASPTLLVRSGSLRLDPGGKGKAWIIDDLKGKVTSRDGSYRLELNGTSGDSSESWQCDATFHGEGDREFKLTIDRLDMAKAAARLSLDLPLHGEADVTLEAPRARELSFAGSLESKQLQVKKATFTEVKSRFRGTGQKISVESLEGNICKGQFKGSGEITRGGRAPLLRFEGELVKASTSLARELAPRLPGGGTMNATVRLGGTLDEIGAEGAFTIDKPRIEGLHECSSIQGNFSLKGERLSLVKTDITAREGKGRIDGTITGNKIDMTIKVHELDLGAALPPSSPLTLAPGGTLEGRLAGTTGESRFEGALAIPGVAIGNRQAGALQLSGTITMPPRSAAFEGLALTLGKKQCLVNGSAREGVGGKMEIQLQGLPLSLLDLFSDPGGHFEGSPLSVQATTGDDALSAEVKSGKGAIALKGMGAIDFKSLSVSLASGKNRPLSLKGTLERTTPISLEGTMEKGELALTIHTAGIQLKDFSLKGFTLSLSGKGRATSGSLAVNECAVSSFEKEKAGKVQLAFKGEEGAPLGFNGSLLWRGHPFTLAGSFQPGDIFSLTAKARDFPLATLLEGKKLPVEGKGDIHLSLGRGRGKNEVTMDIRSAAAGKQKEAKPSFNAHITLKNDLLEFSPLELRNGEKALSLRGNVAMKGLRLSLKGALRDQSISDYAFLNEKLLSRSRGSLTGEIQLEGTLEAPLVSFKGTCRDLVVNDLPCGTGTLTLSQDKEKLSGSFTPRSADTLLGAFVKGEGKLNDLLVKGWKSLELSFQGKDEKSIAFSGSGEQSSLGRVSFKGERSGDDISLNITPQRLALDEMTFPEPSLHISAKGGKLQGTISAGSATVQGTTISSPQFSFEEKEKGLLAFSGTCGIPQGDATISGESRGGPMNLKITIPSFSLKNLDMLKDQGANLSGTARLEAQVAGKEEKTMTFKVESDSIRWKDKKLPRITLEGEKKKTLILISALRIYIDGKPLFFAGNVVPDREKVLLNGRMEGMSIAPLVDMMGGKAPDIQGALSGTIAIDGDLRKPDFRYQGRILSLNYQGRQMGDGNLNVSGNKDAIKGKLDLDKRPTYKAGIAPANLEMSYFFIIEGTPQNMVIKPQTADTRVNINPNLIWQLFRMGH